MTELTPPADDELVRFADEPPPSPEGRADAPRHAPWKILIADDDEEVHHVTRMVLEDFVFEDRGVTFLNAYSGAETRNLMASNPDVAVLLLDVVMETDEAGLEAVRYIRNKLQNHFVRIILRTGQPGKAPERRVITDYDINDYKEKTDLTAQKLFTAVTSALRAHRDLRIIDRSRRGLELIVQSSGNLFASHRLQEFTQGVLIQLSSLLCVADESLFMRICGFAAAKDRDALRIISATGEFADHIDRDVHSALPQIIRDRIDRVLRRQLSLFEGDAFVGYFQTENGSRTVIYLTGCRDLTPIDRDLVRIFCTNVGVALDNIHLSNEIVQTQKEVIETLGGVVETRSKETAHHVRRVAEYARLLAGLAGLTENESNLITFASPMHDVGKIGIPDAILNKPGRLTPDELEIIKTHTTIGYEILKPSRRKIIRAAAIVAHQHHERWDGGGYPRGLSGENIHIFGRITCLADVFDAVRQNRVYKASWSRDQAIELIRSERGGHFEPRLVDLFLGHIEQFDEIHHRYADE